MQENRLVIRNFKKKQDNCKQSKTNLINILLETFYVFVTICSDKNLSRTKPIGSNHKNLNEKLTKGTE